MELFYRSCSWSLRTTWPQVRHQRYRISTQSSKVSSRCQLASSHVPRSLLEGPSQHESFYLCAKSWAPVKPFTSPTTVITYHSTLSGTGGYATKLYSVKWAASGFMALDKLKQQSEGMRMSRWQIAIATINSSLWCSEVWVGTGYPYIRCSTLGPALYAKMSQQWWRECRRKKALKGSYGWRSLEGQGWSKMLFIGTLRKYQHLNLAVQGNPKYNEYW